VSDERERHQRDHADRGKVPVGVIRRLLQVRHDRYRPARRGEQGVAVGQALHGHVGADRAAGAGAVVDDERLPERLLQLLGHQARGDIGGLPRRPGHDDFHRPVRVALRERDRRQKQCTHECG